MYTTQKHVPIPKPQRLTSGSRRKYPLDTMEIDEMFFVPDKEKNSISTHIAASGAALGRKFITRLTYMTKTKRGWKLATREAAGAVQGVGVWRTE
jgi:hypothetical protein